LAWAPVANRFFSAVVMGIVKSIYQIAFGAQPDKTFNQSIQFWGL
jgi:hypothetical protein